MSAGREGAVHNTRYKKKGPKKQDFKPKDHQCALSSRDQKKQLYKNILEDMIYLVRICAASVCVERK